MALAGSLSLVFVTDKLSRILPTLPGESAMYRITACLVLFVVSALPALGGHHEEGFHSLFDGKTLNGWDGNPKFWTVEEGAITGRTTKENPTNGNTFIIYREGPVDDFELRLRFKIVGGNSGIQYRSADKGNWVVGGYQADFESKDTYSGILYEERGRGILAQRGQLTRVFPGEPKPNIEVVASVGESMDINQVIKKEDWNDYKIIANGNQFVHIINNRMTCQVIDEDQVRGAKSGILALQLHAGDPMTVQFKDIRIKPLSGAAIAGTWDFDVMTEYGNGSPKFTFAIDGNQLTGDYSGLFGERSIAGTVKEGTLSWTVEGELNGETAECVYEGKATGLSSMRGSLTINGEIEGTWTARRTSGR